MIIMLAIGGLIMLVNIATFWLPMWPIKHLLVIQAIQMSLMNFNTLNPSVVIAELSSKRLENYMAMNVIISVFSTMCITFNGILINTVFQKQKQIYRFCLVAGIFGMNILCIVFSKFIIHDDMRVEALVTLIFSVVYTFVLVCSFLWIIDFLQEEKKKLESEVEQ